MMVYGVGGELLRGGPSGVMDYKALREKIIQHHTLSHGRL